MMMTFHEIGEDIQKKGMLVEEYIKRIPSEFPNHKTIMSKQNIYDNDTFFENFRSSRSNEVNFNDCIETPIIFAMLPDLYGKVILDIGCGMGQHTKEYAQRGAESVLGIDISEKMLDYAKGHNNAENIVYQRMAMEDIETIDRKFDLITSSLVFDYVEDFDGLMQKIYKLMKENAEFGQFCENWYRWRFNLYYT